MRSIGVRRAAFGTLLRALVLAVLAIVVPNGLGGLLGASSDCCATAPIEAELEAAEHDGCCDGAEATDGSEGDHCPCQLPCNAGCAGQSLRALAAAPSAGVDVPVGVRLCQPILRELGPPGPEPGDILHVPRSIRA